MINKILRKNLSVSTDVSQELIQILMKNSTKDLS